jgi:hypothetical protein
MAVDMLSVGEAATELTADLGTVVKPKWISTLFYDRELRDDMCPLVGGRRLIPRGYLPMIAAAIRQRGWIKQGAEVSDR